MLKNEFIEEFKNREKRVEKAYQEVDDAIGALSSFSTNVKDYVELVGPGPGAESDSYILRDKESGKMIHLHSRNNALKRDVYWYENGEDTKRIDRNSEDGVIYWSKWLLFNS